MNTDRRKQLQIAKMILKQAYDTVDRVKLLEENSMENIPESLQSTDRYEKMEFAVDNLDGVMGNIDSALEGIEEAMR